MNNSSNEKNKAVQSTSFATAKDNDLMVVSLKQCFSTIVDRKPLSVSMSTLRHILVTDLNINILTLQTGMENVLAEALAYYMRLWPGWNHSTQYFSGQLQFKKWFEKFRQYLIYKMNYIIMKSQSLNQEKDDDVEIIGDDSANTKVKVDSEIQTEPLSVFRKNDEDKPYSPYQLTISGSPQILNTLVFVKQGNNILMKHYSHRPWVDLSLPQLLNYPFVGFQLTLPDISIWRTNIFEYNRYIGFFSDIKKTSPVNTDIAISKIKGPTHAVFSLNYLQIYVKQFIEILKLCPKVGADRVELIDVALQQFIKDIDEADTFNKTFCTYTKVSYHIGKSIYFRNKRINSNEESKNNIVNFYEYFAPKVEYGIHNFKPAPDLTLEGGVNFKNLNKILTCIQSGKLNDIESFFLMINNNWLVLHCRLCNKNFNCWNNKEMLIDHLKEEHKLEQSVLCFKCRKQYDVLELTEKRWKHNCSPSKPL